MWFWETVSPSESDSCRAMTFGVPGICEDTYSASVPKSPGVERPESERLGRIFMGGTPSLPNDHGPLVAASLDVSTSALWNSQILETSPNNAWRSFLNDPALPHFARGRTQMHHPILILRPCTGRPGIICRHQWASETRAWTRTHTLVWPCVVVTAPPIEIAIPCYSTCG